MREYKQPVYKDKGKKGGGFYRADIWLGGKRHRWVSKLSDKDKAIEAATTHRLKLIADAAAAAEGDGGSLLLPDVAERYIAQFENDAGEIIQGSTEHAKNRERLVTQAVQAMNKIAPRKLITEITHQDALNLRAWRAATRVPRKHKPESAPFVSAYVVNDTIAALKSLFTFCRNCGVPFKAATMPKWRELWLAVPTEHVRELSDDEAARLDDAIIEVRDDYWSLIEFARACGKRKTECFTLEWEANVKWGRNVIQLIGKGGKRLEIPLTPTIRAILLPLYEARHQNAGVPAATERVFTYVAQRTSDKVIRGVRYTFVKGQRYPITKWSLRNAWDSIRREARFDGRFRFHDIRHDTASKVVRSAPSAEGLKEASRLLGHAKITTTLQTYSHILEGAAGQAIDRVAELRKTDRSARKRAQIKAVS